MGEWTRKWQLLFGVSGYYPPMRENQMDDETEAGITRWFMSLCSFAFSKVRRTQTIGF